MGDACAILAMGCMLPQGYRSMPFIFPFLFSTCPGCTVSPTTCWLSFWLSWERADHWTPATASSSRAGARFSLGEMSFPFDFYGCSTRSSFFHSFTQKNIESVLRKYIRDYVTCHTCKSPTTILAKHSRLYFLQCEVRRYCATWYPGF